MKSLTKILSIIQDHTSTMTYSRILSQLSPHEDRIKESIKLGFATSIAEKTRVGVTVNEGIENNLHSICYLEPERIVDLIDDAYKLGESRGNAALEKLKAIEATLHEHRDGVTTEQDCIRLIRAALRK